MCHILPRFNAQSWAVGGEKLEMGQSHSVQIQVKLLQFCWTMLIALAWPSVEVGNTVQATSGSIQNLRVGCDSFDPGPSLIVAFQIDASSFNSNSTVICVVFHLETSKSSPTGSNLKLVSCIGTTKLKSMYNIVCSNHFSSLSLQ